MFLRNFDGAGRWGGSLCGRLFWLLLGGFLYSLGIVSDTAFGSVITLLEKRLVWWDIWQYATLNSIIAQNYRTPAIFSPS